MSVAVSLNCKFITPPNLSVYSAQIIYSGLMDRSLSGSALSGTVPSRWRNVFTIKIPALFVNSIRAEDKSCYQLRRKKR